MAKVTDGQKVTKGQKLTLTIMLVMLVFVFAKYCKELDRLDNHGKDVAAVIIERSGNLFTAKFIHNGFAYYAKSSLPDFPREKLYLIKIGDSIRVRYWPKDPNVHSTDGDSWFDFPSNRKQPL